MKTSRFLSCALLLAASLLGLSQRVGAQEALKEVEASGSASLQQPNHRSLALGDALRSAVRQGAGVDLLANTQVTDYATDFDRVFERSFGYVRSYRILGSSTDAGRYTVTIRAQVGAGRPEAEDRMALQQIIRAKGSPRVVIDVEELYETERMPEAPVSNWLRGQAVNLGFDVMRGDLSQQAASARARANAFHGDEAVADLQKAQLQSVGDFLIGGQILCRYLEAVNTSGLNQHRFSVQGHLTLTQPGRDQVLIQLDLPPVQVLSSKRNVSDGAVDALRKVMEGRKSELPHLAKRFYGKMLTLWITQLDLGSLVSVELYQLSRTALANLVQTLGTSEGITSVRQREFDARGMTRLDVESRLDSMSLGNTVLGALGEGWDIVREDRNFIDLRPVDSVEAREDPDPGTRSTALVWILAGVGGVLVLVAAVLLLRKK